MAGSMTKTARIGFTCTEAGGLWSSYIQESMAICFLKHFLQHAQDLEIKALLKKSLALSEKRIHTMKELFQNERFPIPAGFSDSDLNLNAPPLYYDTFALSFVYMMNRLNMINFSFIATTTVRLDVLDFFTDCLRASTELFEKAVKALLAKGLYDRPPSINYPERIEFVHQTSFLSGLFGKKRPLNTIELTEIFFNLERNYFSIILMIGFAQVIQDKSLTAFMLRGKEISEKQIEHFNNILREEDLTGIISVNMTVTESTVSPFSDKLIMAMINALNAVDTVLISRAAALSMRADLVALYAKTIAEVGLFAKDTMDIMIEREWLEQPPLLTNRDALIDA